MARAAEELLLPAIVPRREVEGPAARRLILGEVRAPGLIGQDAAASALRLG